MEMKWSFSPGRWKAASASLFAALLLLLGGTATAQIAGTKHNLGLNSTAGNNRTTDTAEVCVFCHTPHGAAVAPAPLWNKRLTTDGTPPGGGTYTTYQSLQTPSLDGSVAPVGGVSMACLSCHDGTQAMDNVINAPGSGLYDATGGGTAGRAWNWGGSPRIGPDGQLGGGPDNVALLGTNLSNDHPIGIQYCGGGLGPTGAITGCRDQDFQPTEVSTINGNQVFWLETGGTGKQRTDLPLYVRPGETTATGPLVECASCHDPHVSSGQAGPTGTGRVAGETFLRISNANSAVCTACHVK